MSACTALKSWTPINHIIFHTRFGNALYRISLVDIGGLSMQLLRETHPPTSLSRLAEAHKLIYWCTRVDLRTQHRFHSQKQFSYKNAHKKKQSVYNFIYLLIFAPCDSRQWFSLVETWLNNFSMRHFQVDVYRNSIHFKYFKWSRNKH